MRLCIVRACSRHFCLTKVRSTILEILLTAKIVDILTSVAKRLGSESQVCVCAWGGFSAGVSVTILQIFLNPKIVDILTSVAKSLGSESVGLESQGCVGAWGGFFGKGQCNGLVPVLLWPINNGPVDWMGRSSTANVKRIWIICFQTTLKYVVAFSTSPITDED